MKDVRFVIQVHDCVAKDVWKLELCGDTTEITTPGQFVNVAIPGSYLRRPLSVCDWNRDSMTLLYKVVGQGTENLSHMKKGAELSVLTGLGNGFNLEKGGHEPVLAGGGMGIAPLLGLAKHLLKQNYKPRICMGFSTADDVLLRDEFLNLGLPVDIATIDGTAGIKGFVTDLNLTNAYVFACGPEPMLRAVYTLCADGQFSFESRMGCGFGACMGCSCQTNFGPRRICKDGPVFRKEEILWGK